MEKRNDGDGTPIEGTKTILVVEDNEIVSSLIKVVLEEYYHIVIRADGQEGLNYLKQGNHPHLILLDMMMPIMNGGTFVRHVSANPSFGKIPIIFITTIDSTRLMNKFKDLVVDYIVKPFNKEELIKKVNNVLK